MEAAAEARQRKNGQAFEDNDAQGEGDPSDEGAAQCMLIAETNVRKDGTRIWKGSPGVGIAWEEVSAGIKVSETALLDGERLTDS